jgi:hypothetical protein
MTPTTSPDDLKLRERLGLSRRVCSAAVARAAIAPASAVAAVVRPERSMLTNRKTAEEILATTRQARRSLELSIHTVAATESETEVSRYKRAVGRLMFGIREHHRAHLSPTPRPDSKAGQGLALCALAATFST